MAFCFESEEPQMHPALDASIHSGACTSTNWWGALSADYHHSCTSPVEVGVQRH